MRSGERGNAGNLHSRDLFVCRPRDGRQTAPKLLCQGMIREKPKGRGGRSYTRNGKIFLKNTVIWLNMRTSMADKGKTRRKDVYQSVFQYEENVTPDHLINATRGKSV